MGSRGCFICCNAVLFLTPAVPVSFFLSSSCYSLVLPPPDTPLTPSYSSITLYHCLTISYSCYSLFLSSFTPHPSLSLPYHLILLYSPSFFTSPIPHSYSHSFSLSPHHTNPPFLTPSQRSLLATTHLSFLTLAPSLPGRRVCWGTRDPASIIGCDEECRPARAATHKVL